MSIPDGDDDEHFGNRRIVMESSRNSMEESETSHFSLLSSFSALRSTAEKAQNREKQREEEEGSYRGKNRERERNAALPVM